MAPRMFYWLIIVCHFYHQPNMVTAADSVDYEEDSIRNGIRSANPNCITANMSTSDYYNQLSYLDESENLIGVVTPAGSSACQLLIESHNCSVLPSSPSLSDDNAVTNSSNTTIEVGKTIVVLARYSVNFTIIDSSKLLLQNLSINLRIFETDSGHLVTLYSSEIIQLRIVLQNLNLITIQIDYLDSASILDTNLTSLQYRDLSTLTIVFIEVSLNETTSLEDYYDASVQSNNSLILTIPVRTFIDLSRPTYLIFGAPQSELPSVPLCLHSVRINQQSLLDLTHPLLTSHSPHTDKDKIESMTDSTTIIIIVVVCVFVVLILGIVAFFLYRYIRQERASHGIYKPNMAESRAAPDLRMVSVMKVPPPERLI